MRWRATETRGLRAGWVGVGSGSITMLLTEALIIIDLVVTIGVLVLMHRATMILSHQMLEAIDERLAAAIKSLVEDLPLEGIEPPSPIAQFLLGMLQQNMTPPGSPRDMKGQFASVIEIDGDSS